MNFETIINELFYAIQREDLDTTKKYVNLLNSIPSERDMAKFLEINKLINGAFTNLCYDYVLLNLNSIDKQERELIRWKRHINMLLHSGNYDDDDIESFILTQINNLSYQISHQNFIEGLYKLARNINDVEKSLLIFNKINNIKGE